MKHENVALIQSRFMTLTREHVVLKSLSQVLEETRMNYTILVLRYSHSKFSQVRNRVCMVPFRLTRKLRGLETRYCDLTSCITVIQTFLSGVQICFLVVVTPFLKLLCIGSVNKCSKATCYIKNLTILLLKIFMPVNFSE